MWHKAKNVAVEVYESTQQEQFHLDYHLIDQMRRGAISLCGNIAEGDERDTDKDSARFLHIAKGSLPELSSLLEMIQAIGKISREDNLRLQEQCVQVGKMPGRLIKVRRQTYLDEVLESYKL